VVVVYCIDGRPHPSSPSIHRRRVEGWGLAFGRFGGGTRQVLGDGPTRSL
jgi:hypothetical protein